MIIDASYFTGSIFIPQIGDGASSIANNDNKLQQAIDQYEAEILVKALGRKLTKEFLSNINPATKVLVNGADAKWSNLLNGHDYVKNGDDFYWRGLIDTTGILKESLIAYYIYYNYVREGQTVMTTMGAKKGNSQNTTDANATSKLVNAWRSLHKWYSGENYGCYNVSEYKGHIVEDYFGNDNSKDVSLYQFMTDNSEDYTGWSFTALDNKNEFGI